MRFVPLLAFLTVIATCDAFAQDPRFRVYDWKTYPYPDEGFSVDFPDTPTLKEVPHPDGIVLLSRVHSVTKIAGGFTVFATHIRHDAMQSVSPEQFVRRTIGMITDRFKCTVRSDLTIPVVNGSARQLVFDTCSDGTVTSGRYYVVGDWKYDTYVVTKPEVENSLFTKRFLESFKVTAP
jgi:hypothetical protein